MRDYCRAEVQKGRYRFSCPERDCRMVWEWFLVRHVANFDDATRSQIERSVTENYIRQAHGCQQCPGCKTWCNPVNAGVVRLRCPACSASDKSYDFCWACQRPWKGSGVLCCGNEGCDGRDPRIKILAVAERIIIDNVSGCPSIRACPKCGLLINHVTGCRHMTCRSPCNAEFCFICLRRWGPGLHRFGPCQVAPVQTTFTDPTWDQRPRISEQRPNNSNYSSCAIL